MDETWILHNATGAEATAWLAALADRARAAQAADATRSQAPICRVGAVDLLKLPLPVRAEAQSAAGIFTQLPSADAPFGHVVLLLLIEKVAARTLRLEIVTDPTFALRAEEIRSHLRCTFAHAVRGAAGHRTGLLLAINRADMALPARTGAPVLACNIWLEEQLLALGPERRGRRRLFRPWLEEYHKLRGEVPADPMRSFRAAVAGCERRLALRQAQETTRE